LPAFDVIGVVVSPDFVGELGMPGFDFTERHRRKSATTQRLKDSFFVRRPAAASGQETVLAPVTA
jgi:hypothetical protein